MLIIVFIHTFEKNLKACFYTFYTGKRVVNMQIIFEDFSRMRTVVVALKKILLVLFIRGGHHLWPSLVAQSEQQKTFLLFKTILVF